MGSSAGSTPTARPPRQARGGGAGGGEAPSTPVFLNVYDVTPANGYARWLGLGVYHSGVQVHGVEYAYGAHDGASSGIFEVVPRRCPGYTFRESVLVGTTGLTRAEVRALIAELAADFPGGRLQPGVPQLQPLLRRRVPPPSSPAPASRDGSTDSPRLGSSSPASSRATAAPCGARATCPPPPPGASAAAPRGRRPPPTRRQGRGPSSGPLSVGGRRNLTTPRPLPTSPPPQPAPPASTSTSSGSTT
ncbi:hypothetical protein SEVIR_4G048700v4 [Setaria viridis]